MQNKHSHSSFSGQLGFVMAAAGSAVGLGNIWRFPYLAAKDGGGVFLVIYLVLVLTALLYLQVILRSADIPKKAQLKLMKRLNQDGAF